MKAQYTIKEAEAITHTLSAPSKMPCHSYSIPARKCHKGSLLRTVKGSVCESCYALKGRYVFDNVQDALNKRFDSLQDPRHENAMVSLILQKEKSGFFRWFDSGDLQSVEHLRMIVSIANRLPQICFWLPTREYSIVSEFVASGGIVPDNLNIRLSAYMVNGLLPHSVAARVGATVSGVHDAENVPAGAQVCPSSKQGNKCLDCRACWDKNVPAVSYPRH